MGEVLSFQRAAVRGSRPLPPASLGAYDDFEADQDGLGAWARRTFIDEGAMLENPRHAHLRQAEIGWLWTTAECTNRDRRVAGTCQLIQPVQKKWTSARQHWLLRHWFGMVPDFLITIDAAYAAETDDWAFCALIEHELCHAAQDIDAFGGPAFDQEGRPRFRTITHDVEQFTDVVARYGMKAADVEAMVHAANAGPTIGMADMSAACGTCSTGRRSA